ncbi:hypothetical protein BT96DRAFT_458618 [Gymnopus androsaceus JB14]|uniref:Uncharacterized protein n=1 Tax=Gymnopus androsaceus JB14 TaxID=1447944 RepID=A0A6A4IIM8_9AGAR|nr:hypothetical protein BT96DRAFT_458618 [Gymnopus androsaceus JB14]
MVGVFDSRRYDEYVRLDFRLNCFGLCQGIQRSPSDHNLELREKLTDPACAFPFCGLVFGATFDAVFDFDFDLDFEVESEVRARFFGASSFSDCESDSFGVGDFSGAPLFRAVLADGFDCALELCFLGGMKVSDDALAPNTSALRHQESLVGNYEEAELLSCHKFEY